MVPKLDVGPGRRSARGARARLLRRVVERPARARRAARRRPQGRRRGGPHRLRALVVRSPAAATSSSPAGARDHRPAGAQGRGGDRGRPPRLRARRAGATSSRGTALRPGISERELNAQRSRPSCARRAPRTRIRSSSSARTPRTRTRARPSACSRAGDVVCADISACLDGYWGDLTRCATVGPPSDWAREIWALVRDAQAAAIAACTPGTPARDVEAAQRVILETRPDLGEVPARRRARDRPRYPRAAVPRPKLCDAARPRDDLHRRAGPLPGRRSAASGSRTTSSSATAVPRSSRRSRSSSSSCRCSRCSGSTTKGGTSERYRIHRPQREPPAACRRGGRARWPSLDRRRERASRTRPQRSRATSRRSHSSASPPPTRSRRRPGPASSRPRRQAGVTAKFFDPNFNAQTQVSQIQDAITSGQLPGVRDPGERRQRRDPGDPAGGQDGHRRRRRVHARSGATTRRSSPPIPGVTFVGESPVHNGTELGALGIQACKGLEPVQRRLPRGLQVAAARQRAHGGGEEAARDREQRQARRRRRGRLHAGLGAEGRPGRAPGALRRERA